MMLSAASTVMQTKAAEAAQARAERRAAMQAEKEAKLREAELAQQRKEEAQKASLDTFERQRQLRRQQSSTLTSRANAGVLGNSVLAELMANEADASFDVGIVKTNQKNADARAKVSRGFINFNKRTKTENAKGPRSSALALGMAVGSSAASGFSSGYSVGKEFD